MHRVYPCGGVTRRHFLAAAPASISFLSALSGSPARAQEAREQASAEATHAGIKAKAKGVNLLLPVDNVLADSFSPDAKTQPWDTSVNFPADWQGLDIGPKSVAAIEAVVKTAKTIVWNGPAGVFEFPKFAVGTNAIAKAVAANKGAISIIGGGDSVSAINQAGVADQITHISTGGGASLEFLEGKKLPGVEALTDK